jgi:hypothetical protein
LSGGRSSGSGAKDEDILAGLAAEEAMRFRHRTRLVFQLDEWRENQSRPQAQF